jgi:isopentenyl phosphate kinase
MHLIVLKIGGSCLSYKKEGIPHIRRSILLNMTQEIKKAKRIKPFRLIVVHGGGSITHPLFDKYEIAKKIKLGKLSTKGDKLSTAKIHLAMNKLNNEISRIFQESGLPAWPMQTSALAFSKKGKAEKHFFDSAALAVSNGYIPILHGDLVQDEKNISSIFSGDLVACLLAKKLGADELLFASDIDGVYSHDPACGKKMNPEKKLSNSEFLKIITRNRKNKEFDHSGGMKAKLESIRKHCQGITTTVFSGLKKGNLEQALLGKNTGTRIYLK